jgi:hypothetical protein
MSFLGDIIGGGLSFLGARESAKAGIEAAQTQADAAIKNAAAATQAATPFTIGSLGGVADFDAEKKAGFLGLSPQLSDIYAGALERSGMFGEQGFSYAAMDPFAAGELFFQQSDPFYQQQQDRSRAELETKLLAQGRLGSTGGALEQEALETAISNQQMQRREAGFTKAQALIDTLLGRERGDIAQAVGLLDIPLQQANVGRGVGGTIGTTAAAGLASQASSQELLAKAQGQYPGMFGLGAAGLGNYITKNFGTQPPKT